MKVIYILYFVLLLGIFGLAGTRNFSIGTFLLSGQTGHAIPGYRPAGPTYHHK